MAVIVVYEGRTVYRNAIGMADIAQRLPLDPEHLFAVGSMTKPLTAVGCMTLIEERKVSLDDPLSDYLPDHPSGNRAGGGTI